MNSTLDTLIRVLVTVGLVVVLAWTLYLSRNIPPQTFRERATTAQGQDVFKRETYK